MSTPTAFTDVALEQLIDLRGRTAVVTGGAMGIGLGIVRRLHEAGAAVVIADLDAAAAGAVATELNDGRADSALPLRADVSEPAEVDAVVAAAVDRFGGLDVFVNNAGIFPFVPFLELDLETFERVLRVNLTGAFLGMQAAARQMIAQGRGGRIVNVTSIDALHPSMTGLAHYDASKHGLWGLTKNVALELAQYGIAVNALAPGAVATPGTQGLSTASLDEFRERIPLHRMADPDEMGRAVLFLASDLASYMTGSQIVVDGGMLLR
ncbi:MAG TPA: SDR family NAD(P)-dependent oxidoreductase [Conexibacter sp.]|nr:SDR family NAD(P)-dependent oxidoreductase [Conexibacter sp.]